MKRNLPFLLVGLIIITFSSCQKSYSPGGVDLNPPSSGGGSTGGGTTSGGALLLKLIGVTGTDTTSISSYSYDANNRLTGMSSYSKTTTPPTSIQTVNYVITRNSNGYITQYTKQTITSSSSTNAPVAHVLHYPSGSNNCDYQVAKEDVGGGIIYRDSIVFKYNGSTITGYNSYSQVDGISPYAQYATTAFAYDSKGNTSLIKLIVINTSTGATDGVEEFSCQYDAKNNPLDFGNDMIYLGQAQGVTKNNVTNLNINVVSGSSTTTVNAIYTFNYNAAGYPTSGNFSATGNLPVDPSSAKITYIYK